MPTTPSSMPQVTQLFMKLNFKSKNMKNILIIIISIGLNTACQAQSRNETSMDNQLEILEDNAGLKRFMEQPSSYGFKCGCDEGKMKTVELKDNGEMQMTYYYLCGGKKLHGILMGKYDEAEQEFRGTYNTEDKLYYGSINVKWNAKGEGSGTWKGGGSGTVEMKLL